MTQKVPAWDEYWAHTPRDPRVIATHQTMLAHVTNVAQMAGAFARPLGAEQLAKWCGLLHDAGKYSDAFQRYLRDCQTAASRGQTAPGAGTAEHKTAGAKMVFEIENPIGLLLAGCILGHHAGLPLCSKPNIKGLIATKEVSGQTDTAISRAMVDLSLSSVSLPSPADIPAIAALAGFEVDERSTDAEMLMRMVFSCLVDSDTLDTVTHFHPKRARERKIPSLADLADGWLEMVKERVNKLQAGSSEGKVRSVRAEVFQSCLNAGKLAPGLYLLTVPTGGGKTLSSLAFALQHAIHHARSRIIYAIPYTSIVEQTAKVFRDILGDRFIVEHHSAMDWRTSERIRDDENAQDLRSWNRTARLAAENWDAPLIITTTVQLFESLFSNRTSRCRKLHNLAGSIIILDEVQTLPLHLLQPLVSGLGALLRLCNVTVVLCTATQPALTGQSPLLRGLPQSTPIIADPKPHFEALSRVTYRVEVELWDWPRVAAEMTRSGDSSMAVLNTKNDALALLKELSSSGGVVRHLSTLLCGAHRRAVLDDVKSMLEAERSGGPPVLLVATQVIEAGVDIDFPRVLRAQAPLDRMIQAAGRCNREGRRPRETSEVVLFVPAEGGAPPGDYRTAIDVAWNQLRHPDGPPDLDSPDVATKYFAELYAYVRKEGLDRKDVQSARISRDFPEVANRVRLIEDDTVPVLVPYCRPQHEKAPIDDDGFQNIVSTIRNYGMSRERWQEIQPLTVAIRKREADRLMNETLLEILIPDQLLLWSGSYDTLTGIGGVVNRAVEDLIV